jgi:hypothetical protein
MNSSLDADIRELAVSAMSLEIKKMNCWLLLKMT